MPLGVDAAAVERVRALMGHIPGVVLTTPGSVAWATGGLNIPIDRTAATDVIWVAIGQQSATVITTNVEHARLAAECGADVLLASAPWWTPRR
jgi:Xaa-Pro dipeptidase